MAVDSAGREGEPAGDRRSPVAAPEALKALASPTLAALYASQGHDEVAAAIYAQLDARDGGSAGAETSDSSRPERREPGLLFERLLALRQAARRRRAAAEGAAPLTGIEDIRHDR